ncbi:MAG: McrB family protein, partial [Acidimicrobiia bacterium]
PAPAPAGAAGAGVVAGTVELLTGGSALQRGWPERLARPAPAKATPAYVVRVNAHNHFFDGTICTAPAGNRACASSERFKLDFCEKGVRRCAWLAAFAGQPRVELTDPFVDEYRPVIEETPPEAGDLAVLWAATDAGNEVVGLWRVLAVAPARRGWVLNGDRDAAVLLPKGIVPWSAVYRRWSSPRGSQSLRTLDAPGLEGLLVEVRDHLAPLAATQPGVQRDLAALEVMLADQRARQAEAPAPAGNGAAGGGKAPVPAAPRKAKRAAKAQEPAPPENLHARLRARGGFYTPNLVAQYEMAVAESRLVILAGPSGTGKTRLAGEAADELGAAFCLVAVRPDWHANEDLLGYLPPFPGARFSSTPASQFIVAAAGDPGRPYHLCLDEMNLARPEHYLAELLSKMEVTGGRVAFHTGAHDDAGFPAEVAYPANLVVIGTVNLDETTQPVSAKILDRSAYLVVEAGELKAFLD